MQMEDSVHLECDLWPLLPLHSLDGKMCCYFDVVDDDGGGVAASVETLHMRLSYTFPSVSPLMASQPTSPDIPSPEIKPYLNPY